MRTGEPPVRPVCLTTKRIETKGQPRRYLAATAIRATRTRPMAGAAVRFLQHQKPQ